MSDYPEVAENAQHVMRIVKNEEERFLQTLKTGSEMLSEFIAELKHGKKDILGGERAFLLHDTYGFPLDLTREICREEKIRVDEAAFNSELEKQRERGRANVVSAFVNFQAVNPGDYPATTFTGYETLDDKGKVLDVVEAKDKVLVITDKTPFYAESGGQIGDKGLISGKGGEFVVETTEKAENVYLHIGSWKGAGRFKKGDEVVMTVDNPTRRATMRNHTATHLLHKALQEILGDHVKQAGSLVNPERLRFDFTHFEAIGPETLEKIENRVNEQILAAHSVMVNETSFDEAVKLVLWPCLAKNTVTGAHHQRWQLFKELCGGITSEIRPKSACSRSPQNHRLLPACAVSKRLPVMPLSTFCTKCGASKESWQKFSTAIRRL